MVLFVTSFDWKLVLVASGAVDVDIRQNRSARAPSPFTATRPDALFPTCKFGHGREHGALGCLAIPYGRPAPQPALKGGKIRPARERRSLLARRLSLAVSRYAARAVEQGEIRDVGKSVFEYERNLAVQLMPTTLKQALIGRIPHQRMLEAVDSLRGLATAEYELRLLELGECMLQCGLVASDQFAQQGIGEHGDPRKGRIAVGATRRSGRARQR